jgi:enediyne biosynthesis protein E4
VYSPQPSHLFRNNRNGTFTDVTAIAGIARDFGPGLGVTTADFNADGWVDMYVANDLQANQLWMNQRDGTFRNTALVAGVALSGEGIAKSSMGVDAGDFDNDGDEDIVITELTGQGSDLYVNDGSGVFVDRSAGSRLRILSLPYTGFGVAWLDFDNDGWLDVLTVNGTVTRPHGEGSGDRDFPFAQRKQLLRNLAMSEFEDVTERAGDVFRRAAVGRGAAFGDLDNDGDTDVVVANDNGRAEVLINQVGSRNHWIGLRLVGAQTRRDMVSARAEVMVEGTGARWRRARADGSYASANDPRVLVGLGRATEVSRVRVIWPNGRTEEWRDVEVDRYTTLQEGTGTAVSGGPGS